MYRYKRTLAHYGQKMMNEGIHEDGWGEYWVRLWFNLVLYLWLYSHWIASLFLMHNTRDRYPNCPYFYAQTFISTQDMQTWWNVHYCSKQFEEPASRPVILWSHWPSEAFTESPITKSLGLHLSLPLFLSSLHYACLTDYKFSVLFIKAWKTGKTFRRLFSFTKLKKSLMLSDFKPHPNKNSTEPQWGYVLSETSLVWPGFTAAF